MNHIKNNWVESEVFHASDLNIIAETVNMIIDSEESLTDKMNNIINDELVSDASTFSSSKIAAELIDKGFKAVIVDELPDVGEKNTMYFKPSKDIEKPTRMGSFLMQKNSDGVISVSEDDLQTAISDLSVGDVFKYKKPSGNKSFVVPSEIDKENLVLKINVEYVDSQRNTLIGIRGVTETITLQDGHYYKLKDIYTLKGTDYEGDFSSMLIQANMGVEVYVFEEVTSPKTVKYNNNTFVPAAQELSGCVYSNTPKMGAPLFVENGKYTMLPPFYDEVIDYSLPARLKVGDILKTTKENTEHLVCVKRVEDDELELIIGGFIDGIAEHYTWAKDECYRFTGFHEAKIDEEDAEAYILQIPTFEKVESAEHVDYEIEGIPGYLQGIKGRQNLKEEWMWVENGWEQIGSGGNSYTKEETDELLSGKQATISDLDTIRSGAALGATALQSETDPTVPAWAKQVNKPSYTAQEVGAISTSTTIPSKTSQLTNDSNFVAEGVIEDSSFVIASHIVEIRDILSGIGFTESAYEERALSTQEQDNITAKGLVTKIGKTVTMQIYEAKTVNGTRDVSYVLPYAPNTAYTAIINSEGVRECNGITYKVSLQTVTVDQTDYSVLTLNHYVSGAVADWGADQNIAFRLDYIAA